MPPKKNMNKSNVPLTGKLPEIEPEIEIIPEVEKEIEPKEEIKIEKPKYTAKFRMWHPYQKKYIHDIPVELELDSWLQCQIDAKIVICL